MSFTIRFFFGDAIYGKRMNTRDPKLAFRHAVDDMRRALANGGHSCGSRTVPIRPLQVVDDRNGRVIGTVTADGVRSLD